MTEMSDEQKEHLASRKEALKKLKQTEARYFEEMSNITPGGSGNFVDRGMEVERTKATLNQLEQIQGMIKDLAAEISKLEKQSKK